MICHVDEFCSHSRCGGCLAASHSDGGRPWGCLYSGTGTSLGAAVFNMFQLLSGYGSIWLDV